MHRRISRIMLAAFALIALVAASAVAAPKSPKPGTGKGHPGIRFGVSKPSGGNTVLTADSGVLSALNTAGVAVTTSGTAQAGTSTFTFPITGGRIEYKKGNRGKGHGAKNKLLSGFVLHAGSGLTLTKTTATGPLSATISDFRISLSAGKSGRIDVALGTGKLKLATLSNVTVTGSSKSISATATLTPDAVSALNKAFGTTLTSRAALGTLVITPTF
jgi:hypothetical protein